MKDYIKINRAIDSKRIREEKNRIEILQKLGMYPREFDYPLTLQFELTGKCNLVCKHCYNRSGDDDRSATTFMTPEKWCELSRQIVLDGGIFQCIISGGEPLLLGDKLFDIMDILHDDGTSFVIITNGFLLTKEKVERFKKYRFFWFQVSIDGSIPEIHDEFRGVKGSWEKAVNGALEVSQAGFPLVVAHTVTPQSMQYTEDMVKLAHSLGAGKIMIGEVLPSGRAIESNDIIFTLEQKNELFSIIDKLSKKYMGIISIERSMDLKTQMDHYSSSNNNGGIIRPNGDFRLDCMAPFIIGNVLQSPIKELWINKGKNAWSNPKVKDYISAVDENTQTSNIRNHVDTDILL